MQTLETIGTVIHTGGIGKYDTCVERLRVPIAICPPALSGIGKVWSTGRQWPLTILDYAYI